MTKVAVVTGANRGIGFAIVRALCKTFEGDVILTSRDVERGQAAVAELGKEGLKPKYLQLDISSFTSIARFVEEVEKNFGGIDVLVNNAGIAYKNASTAPFAEQAEVTMLTNFTGTKNLCEAVKPLLRKHARLAIVSSMSSRFALDKVSAELRAKLIDPNITMQQIDNLMQDFVAAAKVDEPEKRGWPSTAYGVSKIGCTVLARVLQRDWTKASPEKDVVVNSCCPGYVDTDMTSHKGKLHIDQGARNPVYLALLPADVKSPRGEFIENDQQITQWV